MSRMLASTFVTGPAVPCRDCRVRSAVLSIAVCKAAA
jgi:hypothetical protein